MIPRLVGQSISTTSYSSMIGRRPPKDVGGHVRVELPAGYRGELILYVWSSPGLKEGDRALERLVRWRRCAAGSDRDRSCDHPGQQGRVELRLGEIRRRFAGDLIGSAKLRGGICRCGRSMTPLYPSSAGTPTWTNIGSFPPNPAPPGSPRPP